MIKRPHQRPDQLYISNYSLNQRASQFKHLQLNLFDSDENNFASCSDIDADSNHFNMFSHINDYADVDLLNMCLPVNQSVNLQSVLHLNFRSLISRFNVFYAYLKSRKHKFFISEMATNPETENWVDIPGYTELIKSWVGTRGGGLAIFFNNNLQKSWTVRVSHLLTQETGRHYSFKLNK